MLKRSSLFLSLALAQPFTQSAAPLPKDVLTYIDRREYCFHMSGEIPDPSEQERLREVIREINRECRGLDKKKLQLEKKYAPNPVVTARLARLAVDTGDVPAPAPPGPAR